MKKHRPTLADKRRAQPDRTYENLRQKDKLRIAYWMFKSVYEYYLEHGEMPDGAAAREITDKVYEKIVSINVWVPYDEVHRKLLSELPQFEERIKAGNVPEKPKSPAKAKIQSDFQPAPVRTPGSKSRCPYCGRKMKQQFIGLKHCKCGMSWSRQGGFFERTDDMVFALERTQVGKKTKQRPVVRYQDKS